MPMALTGRCIVAYLATRCRCAESDCASRAAWPATAQPLVSHHSPMALVDMSGEKCQAACRHRHAVARTAMTF